MSNGSKMIVGNKTKLLICIVLLASVSLPVPLCSTQTTNSFIVQSLGIMQATTNSTTTSTTSQSATIVTITFTRSATRTLNYSGGYYDGYYDGYKQGYTEAYANGYKDGYNFGYKEGFNAGYESGYKNGYKDGYDVGSNSSKPELAKLQTQYGQLMLATWVLGITVGILILVTLGLYFGHKDDTSVPELVARSRK